MTVTLSRTIPVLRIFSREKAEEFYVGFLGFAVDWQHRYEANFPLYMQVSRSGVILHLTEHHGDACPGATVRVDVSGIEELHRELNDKGYGYAKPGLVKGGGGREMRIADPFGNHIIFSEVKS